MGTTGQSITLANSIIGVGILAMPFCFQKCGVLLATLILLVMGLISRLCCYFLLKSALIARRRNFEFLAFHVFGPAGKMAVEVGMIGFLMGTCIAYFVVVGDLGPQIIAKMFNINQSDILRTSIMVIVSLVCVLPLGLLRNVDSLSNVSAATIGFYFCLVIKVVAEAASQLMTSDWQTRVEIWKPSGLLQCVPIFSMALFCQAQLFEIFESLPTISLEKMTVVTKNAINICTGVYFTLGVFGYVAFCSQEISGNILMSLSPTMGSDVIKLGFVMSLAFSFPLIIFPCRASLYSFLYKKVHSTHHDHIINHSIPEMTFRCITVAIVAVALFISLLLPNIELVLGLVGSTIGVLVCVVFPAACFVHVTFKDTNERVLAKSVVILGLIIMVLGTYANLEAAENKPDRYDDKYITQERIDKIVEDFFQKQDQPDDVYLKPAVKNDPLKERHNSRKNIVLTEIIGDSEVQPPNPIPPDSNEKTQANKIDQEKEKDLIIPPPSPEKVPDTHPKDLKTKLEAQLSNGVQNNNGKSMEKNKDINIVPINNQKNDLKEKKLIETIKQHDEEKNELIKEHKEILDEIIKTKNELDQNKNDVNPEVDPNETKKIALESIKQIADIAIKTIGGVSDKPNLEKNDKKADRLEQLTNDAVKEIAKKAVETIEAIQEIKEKPVVPAPQPVNNVNIPSNVNAPMNVVNPIVAQNTQQVQGAQQHIPVAQQQMSAVQQQNPVAQLQVPAVQQQIPVAQQQVPAIQQQIPIAQQQVPAVQQQISAAQQQVPAVQQQIPVAQQQVPAVQQQIPAAQQQVPAVQQQTPVAQQQVPAVQQQIPVAQQQVPAVQQQIPVAQQQVPAVQQQISAAQQQVPAVQQQIPVAQQQVPAVQQQIPAAQQQVPAVQQQTPVAQQQVPAVQQQIPVAQQQVAAVQQQIPVAQQQVPAVQQQIPVAQQQVPAVQQQIPVAQQQVPAVQQQIPVAHQQVPDISQQMPIAQQQVPAVQRQIPAAQQQVPAVQRHIPAAQQQVPAVQRQIPVVHQQVPAVQQQIPVAQQQVPAVQQKIPAAQQQVPAVQQQIPVAQQQVSAVQQQIPVAQQQVPAVQQQIPVAQQQVKRDVSKIVGPIPNQPHGNQNLQDGVVKTHSHMPDEPQSYKRGEDIQAKKPIQEQKIDQNVPLLMAKDQFKVDEFKVQPDANIQNNVPAVRQKREVIDCSRDILLKPEDRQLCNILMASKKDSDHYLPSEVDMNSVALPKDINFDTNFLYHLRSLKSYEKDER